MIALVVISLEGSFDHGTLGMPTGDRGGGSSRFGARTRMNAFGISKIAQSKSGALAKAVIDKRRGRTSRTHSEKSASFLGNRQ